MIIVSNKERGETEMYKIETLIDNNWVDDAVGQPNEFETEEQAEEAIPEMARIFDSEESEFRVVEI
ncbi:MAG: hypothetical protein WC998_06460 [Candidatus Paceibacterota bacterium]|jgi:hypothetical protein